MHDCFGGDVKFESDLCTPADDGYLLNMFLANSYYVPLCHSYYLIHILVQHLVEDLQIG